MMERMLISARNGSDLRQLRLVWGESWALVESCEGPSTELAYGARIFGHKILFSTAALKKAFGVLYQGVEQTLVEFFSSDDVFLSDLMDVFDCKEAAYSYLSWEADELSYRPT